jgi:4-hydroxythreonine-4-phosphate dehydrogenase
VKPTVAITIGDFNGIGPEIALKAACHPSTTKICLPVLVGPLNVFEHVRDSLKLRLKLEKVLFPGKQHPTVPVADVGEGLWADIRHGTVAKNAGKTAGVAIEHAVSLCMANKVQAIVTAPVSKEAMQLAGYNFPGQTEMIALLSRSTRVIMMLVSSKMRVGLVTIHAPLRTIPESITTDKIVEKAKTIADALTKNFRIPKPSIAVLGLNPHAGEHGVLGTEEKEIIEPAIEQIKSLGIDAAGPFPADAFFGTQRFKSFDAILAMYHDQGLIPVKMSDFGTTVNFSAGLNVIRTSPGHGTAFDIAGKGEADISSMLAAIKMAAQFARTT